MNEIYAPMPEQCGSPLNAKYSDQQLRAYADATHALREAKRPTEAQMLSAAEKAGLWPNTVRHWIPALKRYHDALMAHAAQRPAVAPDTTPDAAALPHGLLTAIVSLLGGENGPTIQLRQWIIDHQRPAEPSLSSRPVPPPISYEQIAGLLQDSARNSKEMHDFAREVIALRDAQWKGGV